jgi:response regulator RpfG family c-di-GMP phosphodiesterase
MAQTAHHDELDVLEVGATVPDRPPDYIGRVLSAVREQLGMELAFVAEFTEDEEVFRFIEGDGRSFGIEKDSGVQLKGTYCVRVTQGRIPEVIPDARHDDRVKNLPATKEGGVGSYIGVPLRFSDGRLYGTLCSVSHRPHPELDDHDLRLLHLISRLIADQLELQELHLRNQELEVRTTGVRALMAALEARDGYTGEHSEAVVELAMAVARAVDLSEEEVAEIEQVALLHDMGKIGIPDRILRKRGPLNDREWNVMRLHPVIGERIVTAIEGLAHLAPAIRAEHERWDGTGYPDGLAGDRIPLASQIVLVCDAYHAMVSDRPYRSAMDPEAARREIDANAGSQFSPSVASALLGLDGSVEAH